MRFTALLPAGAEPCVRLPVLAVEEALPDVGWDSSEGRRHFPVKPPALKRTVAFP